MTMKRETETMARQQRLPFECQQEEGGNAPVPEKLRIRPVDEGEAPPPPADLRLETEPAAARQPDDRPAETAPPKVRARYPQTRPAPAPADTGEDEFGEDDVPISLGQILLEARGKAGLSIADVAERTKVPRAFIEAAENERFDDFPAPLYARGHLAKLCAAYQLAARPVMAMLEAQTDFAPAPREPKAAAPLPATPANLDSPRYQPIIQTQSATAGIGHKITTTIVLLALILIVGLVLVAFGITQWQNWRMNQEDNDLGVDPNATSGPALEEFIVPQPLPLKEIPMP